MSNIISQIEKKLNIFNDKYKKQIELLSNILIIIVCLFITLYDKVPNQLFIYFSFLISIFIISLLFIKKNKVLTITLGTVSLSLLICVIKLFIRTVLFDMSNVTFTGGIKSFIDFYAGFSIIFIPDFILLIIYTTILCKNKKEFKFIKSLVANLMVFFIALFIIFSPKALLPYISYMIFILIISEYSVKTISKTSLFWPILIIAGLAILSSLISPIKVITGIKDIKNDLIIFFKTDALSCFLNLLLSISIFKNLITIFKLQKKSQMNNTKNKLVD